MTGLRGAPGARPGRLFRRAAVLLGAALLFVGASPLVSADLDAGTAERLAGMALACIDREFPNAPDDVLESAADVKPPKELHPAFFGCYDWPSAVQGHWTLVRLLRLNPDLGAATTIRRRLDAHLTEVALDEEARYLDRPASRDFERPYGWAWALRLAAELETWTGSGAQSWRRSMRPVEEATVARLKEYLPKLTRPVRSGTGTNTAFAMAAAIDYARASGRPEIEKIVVSRSDYYFGRDRGCPISYEPSGEDFLSPCLAEADLMRRTLSPGDYARWLRRFLPSLSGHKAFPLAPATATDPTDASLARLDGLNLSRAWMLRGLAAGLPASDSRRATLLKAAAAHETAGLSRAFSGDYAVGNWLATFTVYLLTGAGS
jgi:hypothetical protein